MSLFYRNIGLQAKQLNKSKLFFNRQIILGTKWTRNNHTFRHTVEEKEAGALQDLLRRVTEIETGAISTLKFKPNTRYCVGYCTADRYDTDELKKQLNIGNQDGFELIDSQYKDLLHLRDAKYGGEMFLFKNGTFTTWGLERARSEGFIEQFLNENKLKYEANLEYTVDEDELSDLKGDVIILNPFLPPIMSSKIAFSYGLGRVAKLSKIEATLNQFLEGLCNVPSKIASGELLNMDMSDVQKTAGQLLLFQQSLLINAEDGFLDTPDLHWTKPELEEYCNKVSHRFDVKTRVKIIHKKIDFAKDLLRLAKETVDLNHTK